MRGVYDPFTMLPAIFFGHGNPMNAIAANRYTEAWARIGHELPRPQAVLCISAHWFVPGTGVTISTAPRTIHDFGGFHRSSIESSIPLLGILHWRVGSADYCRRWR